MAETPEQRRLRMTAEARASKQASKPSATYQEEEKSTEAPTPKRSVPVTEMLSGAGRAQWMHEVEVGGTSLPYNQWMQERAHGVR